MINTTIAHYKITAKIGQGGMGEVYRATDTKLDREVAIKVLPDEFADDPKRLARFEREAKALARLNHANIGTIHGFEEHQGKRYLVLELIEGQTLGDRLKRGSLPMAEALEICQGIAEGLEAAHAKGIIHRDLKPDNVMITGDGQVKVLDFGVAKAVMEAASPEASTMAGSVTQQGTLIGTAAYMSPEQANGKPVDQRSDIWSFGCVLYECLTGNRVFKGESISATIGAVLHAEPDWTKLPSDTPPLVERLLRRCLAKDARNRTHHIADARLELNDRAFPYLNVQAEEKNARHWVRHGLPWTLAGVLLLLLIGTFMRLRPIGHRENIPPRASVLSMPLPQSVSLDLLVTPINLAVSPDGGQIAFTGRRSDGTTELFLRSLREGEARPLRDTLYASDPFFSDNGKSLGYSLESDLKTVLLGGSENKFVTTTGGFTHGGDWGGGRIVFCSAPANGEGLTEVPSMGGSAQAITRPDVSALAMNHFFPQILPDGRGLIYTISHGPLDEGRIVAQSQSDPDQPTSVATGSYGRYVSSGHIVYGKSGSLWAVPFNLERFELAGPEAEVLPNVMINPFFKTEVFAVSEGGNGTLVYAKEPAREIGCRLAWIDLEKRTLEPIANAPMNAYDAVAVHQTGTDYVALLTIGGSRCDVWIQQLDRPKPQNLTRHPSNDFSVTWSQNGEFVYFCSDRNGLPDIFRMRADGGRDVVAIVEDKDQVFTKLEMSPDDSKLAYVIWKFPSGSDIAIYDFEQATSTLWKDSVAYESGPSFSPDGDRIAYVSRASKDSREREIFISPLDDSDSEVLIATGENPKWHPEGDKIYFRRGNDLMMARLDPANDFRLIKTEHVLSVPGLAKRVREAFDITPDGERILAIIEEFDVPELKQLVVVQNWFEELRRLAPAEK